MKIRSRLRRSKSNRGFTLVETLCALAVLVLVIMAFTILIVSAGKLNIHTANRQKALDAGTQAAADIKDSGSGSSAYVEFKVGDKEIGTSVLIHTIEKTKGKDSVVLKKMTPETED